MESALLVLTPVSMSSDDEKRQLSKNSEQVSKGDFKTVNLIIQMIIIIIESLYSTKNKRPQSGSWWR